LIRFGENSTVVILELESELIAIFHCGGYRVDLGEEAIEELDYILYMLKYFIMEVV